MSQAPAFKLVTTRPAPDSYKLERRQAPRHSAAGHVTAVCTIDPEGERRRRITQLELHDVSETGLGAICEHPLPPGTRLALLVPSHGPDNGFDMFGQVVRCSPIHHGFAIGIALDQQASACA